MRRALRRRMVAKRFKDLVCWQLAREFERRVYAFTATSAAADDFEYCRQIRKSSSSGARNSETRDHLAAGCCKKTWRDN
jgi:hypothetical protein